MRELRPIDESPSGHVTASAFWARAAVEPPSWYAPLYSLWVFGPDGLRFEGSDGVVEFPEVVGPRHTLLVESPAHERLIADIKGMYAEAPSDGLFVILGTQEILVGPLALPFVKALEPGEQLDTVVRGLLSEEDLRALARQIRGFVSWTPERGRQARLPLTEAAPIGPLFAGFPKAAVTERIARRYERDPALAEAVKARHGYACALCGERPATAAGVPLLDAHHLEGLAAGGVDHALNMIAVCPTCHRLLHVAEVELVSHTVARVVLVVDGTRHEVSLTT